MLPLPSWDANWLPPPELGGIVVVLATVGELVRVSRKFSHEYEIALSPKQNFRKTYKFVTSTWQAFGIDLTRCVRHDSTRSSTTVGFDRPVVPSNNGDRKEKIKDTFSELFDVSTFL